MVIPMKAQNSTYSELLNIEGFYKFVDDLGQMKNTEHFNQSEYATMVYIDKHNIIHAKIVDLSSNIEVSVKELEYKTGENLVEKKLGLPVRKYKVLKNYKQAKTFYEDAISNAKDNQAPKFKVYLSNNYVDNFHSFDRKKFDFLVHGENWRDVEQILKSGDKVININSRFDIAFMIEFMKKASDLNLSELASESVSWIPKDLITVALHNNSKIFLDISSEEEKNLNLKYLKFLLGFESDLKSESASSIMHTIVNVIIKKEEGYFSCLTDDEFNAVLAKNFDTSTELGESLVNLINKEWNNYAPYEKYLGDYKEKKSSEDILMSIFPPEEKSKYIASIDFNPDEAWEYASNKLRGYYSKYRSTEEFRKLFKIASSESKIDGIEVFSHDYKKMYTAVLKSEYPIDESKLQADFLHVLKIAGEVQVDPNILKAKVWQDFTDGLSDKHFEVIAERKDDLKDNVKIVQRKRF